MKHCFLLIFLLTLPYRLCQGQRVGDINTMEMKNSIRLNHIFIDQPDITYTYSDGSEYKLKPKTGILGLHYNFSLTNWLYAGAGFHAASIGDQELVYFGRSLGSSLSHLQTTFLILTCTLAEVVVS